MLDEDRKPCNHPDYNARPPEAGSPLIDESKMWRLCSQCFHKRPYAAKICPECGNLKFYLDVEPQFLTEEGVKQCWPTS